MESKGRIVDFRSNNSNSILFKFEEKITGQTGNDDTKDVETMVPLKYLHIWKTLEMLLIAYESNFGLTWCASCFLVVGTVADQLQTFIVTDAKHYAPVVTLSIQNNVKLLEQLTFDYKGRIN